MAFVALPSVNGWHYVDPDQIVGILATEDKTCDVVLQGGLTLAVSEESYAVYKRLEAHVGAQPGARTLAPQSAAAARPSTPTFAHANGNGRHKPAW